MDIYNEIRICVNEHQVLLGDVNMWKKVLEEDKDNVRKQRYLEISKARLAITKKHLESLVELI